MCFSAEVSYTAGAVLTGAGAVALNMASKPWQKPLAAIPLMFAVQQIAEGTLWLTIGRANYHALYEAAMYIFLFFAQAVWPIFVPFAIWKLERKPRQKKILAYFLGMGLIAGIYLGVCLIFSHPTASIAGNHVEYTLNFPEKYKIPAQILYFLAIVVSPFLSTTNRMSLLAIVAFLSWAVAQFFYTEYLISVWCFFAAIISVVIIVVEWQLQSRARRRMLLEKVHL